MSERVFVKGEVYHIDHDSVEDFYSRGEDLAVVGPVLVCRKLLKKETVSISVIIGPYLATRHASTLTEAYEELSLAGGWSAAKVCGNPKWHATLDDAEQHARDEAWADIRRWYESSLSRTGKAKATKPRRWYHLWSSK